MKLEKSGKAAKAVKAGSVSIPEGIPGCLPLWLRESKTNRVQDFWKKLSPQSDVLSKSKQCKNRFRYVCKCVTKHMRSICLCHSMSMHIYIYIYIYTACTCICWRLVFRTCVFAFFAWWGGVGWGGLITFNGTCTHRWCYVTDLVSCTCRHTWCYATDLVACTCTHRWCYATDLVSCTCMMGWGGVGWGGVGW